MLTTDEQQPTDVTPPSRPVSVAPPAPPLNLVERQSSRTKRARTDPTDGKSDDKRSRSATSELAPPTAARRFAHVDGNFPTFVCLEPDAAVRAALSTVVDALCLPPSFVRTEPASWHVSLSHTFPLRLHQIGSFLAFLRFSLVDTTPLVMSIQPVIKILPDWSSSRCFAAFLLSSNSQSSSLSSSPSQLSLSSSSSSSQPTSVPIDKPKSDVFCQLVRHTDTTARAFGAPPFFDDPTAHLSFAWSKDQPAAIAPATFPPIQCRFDCVTIICGERRHSIPLGDSLSI